MLGYEAGLLSLLPLLDRLECPSERELTIRLQGLEVGGVRFLSGTLRLHPEAP